MPADGAADFLAARHANEGRHGLDVELIGMSQLGIVDDAVEAARKGRIVLGVDDEGAAAAGDLPVDGLDQRAGGAIALGD